ncbi:MAG: sulfatase [Pirellulaceae bacterium]
MPFKIKINVLPILFLSAAVIANASDVQAQQNANDASAQKEQSRPNVLMIAIDDLNDWVGPLKGHPQVKTPAMDALAARGTTFQNAHCQSPLCNPSRTSLMTGMRPSTTGIYGLAPWFRNVEELKDLVAMPQYFMQAGYKTYTAGKIYHGNNGRGKQQQTEFDVWGPRSQVGARPKQKLVETPMGNHPLVDWGTFPHRDEDKGDWVIASWATEQLEAMPKEEPFFMAVGFFLPHVPCYATQKWFDLYPMASLKLPPILDGDRDDTPAFSWNIHWTLPEPRLSWLRESNQLGPLVQAYLASVSFVDSQVGRVLDALNASSFADNTVVVLWSDHGWHLGEKAISGKNSLWDRSARVPLIFAGPGVAENANCDQPVELLDIYPTLVELCGLPPKQDLEGHSLKPQLRDASAPRPWPAITTHNPGNHGVRTERWRYIVYADGSEELYDMKSDPNEWKNLADDPAYKSIKQELAALAPAESAPLAPGSAHRVLWKEGDQWIWEGKPIVPEDRWE